MLETVLHTARLRLRPWTLSAPDVQAFHAIWGNPRVIFWGPSQDAAESRAILAERLEQVRQMPPGMGWWAIESLEADAPQGPLGNAVLRVAQYDDSTEIAYHLRDDAWGRGYMTDSVQAVLRHGFGAVGVPLISGVVLPQNAPSHRVMARLGLRPTGNLVYRDLEHVRYELRAQDAVEQPWWRAEPARP